MRKEPAVSDRKARSNKTSKAVRKKERAVLDNAQHVRGPFLRCEPNSEQEFTDCPLLRWNPFNFMLQHYMIGDRVLLPLHMHASPPCMTFSSRTQHIHHRSRDAPNGWVA